MDQEGPVLFLFDAAAVVVFSTFYPAIRISPWGPFQRTRKIPAIRVLACLLAAPATFCFPTFCLKRPGSWPGDNARRFEALVDGTVARCCSRSDARTFEHHTRRALLLHHSPSPLLLWNQLQNPAAQSHAMHKHYWLIAGPKQVLSPHLSLVSVIACRKHPWNDSSICVQHYDGGLSSWLHQRSAPSP
jgi:hypothetical protein